MSNKVALVTGGSRGIGLAIAQRLVRDKYRVAVNYNRNPVEVGALAVQADLADPAQAKMLVERVERELGPVEVLVNNAGKLARGDFETLESSEFEAMRKINVDGLVAVTRAVLPGMKERRWGRIINLTSIAAHGTSMPGATFYSMTKAAIITLTRRLAYEFGAYGITVNAIAPGFIWTDMVAIGRKDEDLKEVESVMAKKAMLGRVGRPDDIAGVAAFLASDDAAFVTAQTLTVDGGRMDYIGHP